MRELQELYTSEWNKREPQLCHLPVEYTDYARWQRKHLNGAVLDKKMKYWQQQLRNYEHLQLPTDFSRPKVLGHRGAIHTFEIGDHLPALQKNNEPSWWYVIYNFIKRMEGGIEPL